MFGKIIYHFLGKIYSKSNENSIVFLADVWKVTDPQVIEMAQSELRNDPAAMKLFQEGNQEAVWNMLFEKIAKTIGGEYTIIN